MKNLKVFFALTIMVMFVMTSCSKEAASDFQANYQDGDMVEVIVNPDDFQKLDNQMEVDGYEQVIVTEELNLGDLRLEDRFCPPCYPWLSEINHAFDGGYTKGFSVNGGRHFPCSYELHWCSDPGVTINWQHSGFASMTFPGPGTYQVYVSLESKTDETTCITGSLTYVTIP